MKKAIFFDMNETLLNLSLLKEQFDHYFDDTFALKYWFTMLLHSSTVIGGMGSYVDFGKLSSAALDRLFVESNKPLTPVIKEEILGAFKRLPAYDDVRAGLKWLQIQGIRTIAVSNSSLAMTQEQLTNAGIIGLFDAYYSVDSVERYKPFQDIYLYVAAQEHLDVKDIAMVATHDWDLYGAKKAGLSTGYIIRKETIYNPYYIHADADSSNLLDLVKTLATIS